MQIRYHRHFLKRYEKLPSDIKVKTLRAIAKFAKHPFDPRLRNHALKGRLLGKRAFLVTADIRVIFEELNNYIIVIMLDVGTHNQVYN